MSNGTKEREAVAPTEVSAKPKRRRYTAEYKLRILKQADAYVAEAKVGEVGAMLRREGLYSSHLTTWRKARERGELDGLAPKKRGPKATPKDGRDRKLAEQEREIARWKRRAERAEALVELQKKVSEILGITLPDPDEER